VTPFVSGGTLAKWRARTADVSPRTAAEIARQLALGVAHAHERGVLHRDITSGNVLLAPCDSSAPDTDFPYVPKLTDFGLAKCAEIDIDQTRTGSIIGTACYMSPEQAQGRSKEITARSDVYGIGVILFELLTGAPPFRGDNPLQTLQKILTDEPQFPRGGSTAIPADLQVICLKCLEKLPANRYESAKDLADDLERFLNNEPIRARSISQFARISKWCRRHPGRAVAMLGGLAGVAIVFGISLLYNARLTNQLEIIRQKEQIARDREREARERAYVSDMRNAKTAGDQGHVRQMLKLLNRYRPNDGEPDLRDFAWWHLWREYHDASRVMGSHEGGATAVAVTRSGMIAASGGVDGVIRLWSLPDGQLLGELRASDAQTIESLDFSPTGDRLVSAGEEGAVRSWDVEARQELFVRREHQSLVSQAVFSPTGHLIASGGADGQVRLWDSQTGQPAGVFSGHAGRVRCLAFHPTEPVLITAGLEGTVRVWDLQTLEQDSRVPEGIIPTSFSASVPRSLKFDPNGESFVVATFTGDLVQIRCSSPGFGEQVHSESAQINSRGLAWPRPDLLLVTSFFPQILVAQKLPTDGQYNRLTGHRDEVIAIATSADADQLISASKDGDVRYWPNYLNRSRISIGQNPSLAKPDENGFRKAEWKGDYVAVQWTGQGLSLFHMPECEWERTYPVDDDSGFALSSDGRSLLIVDADGEGTCIHISDDRPLWSRRLFSDRHEPNPKCQIANKGDVAAVIAGKDVHIISLSSSKTLHRLVHPQPVESAFFVEDPRGTVSIVTAGVDGFCRFWNREDGQMINEHRINLRNITAAAVSDDGRSLATSDQDRTIHVVQLNDFKELAVIPSNNVVQSLGFLAGSEILVRHDSAISFWKVSDEAELLSFPMETPRGSFAISPDGNQVAIPERDGIRIIDGRPMTESTAR
jgi:WD40 repeat protein